MPGQCSHKLVPLLFIRKLNRTARNGVLASMGFFDFKSFGSFTLVLVSLLAVPIASLAEALESATAQVVYVPSYSRVLTQEGRSEPLASTLVVHNVSRQSKIRVERVDYYDRAGQLLETLVSEPVELTPFGSMNALVPIGSVGDGIGANFIVTWSSEEPVLPPIVEAIMVGGSGTQGISFTSRGRVLSQDP